MFNLSDGGRRMTIVKGMAGPENVFIIVFSELHYCVLLHFLNKFYSYHIHKLRL